MLIVAFGTVASASTWVFNAVRGMLAATRPDAVGLYAEHAAALLDNIGDGAADIVLKTHALDGAMVKLMRMADAHLIVTTRDPRDSVASQMERFGMRFEDGVTQLSRSFASLAALGDRHPALVLRYEDGFAADPQTLARVARHLGLPVEAAVLDALFQASRPERVKGRIARWTQETGLAETEPSAAGSIWDPATHWHPNHVGDGRTGKWRQRLTPSQGQAVAQAFPCDFLGDAWTGLPIRWSAALFRYPDGRTGQRSETLACTGTEAALVSGPGLCLPPGRWRVQPVLRVAPGAFVTLRLELVVDRPGRGLLHLHTFALPVAAGRRVGLEFDNIDHLDRLEIRLTAVGDGQRGAVTFAGVKLVWLGPLDRALALQARPVGDAVVPAHGPELA